MLPEERPGPKGFFFFWYSGVYIEADSATASIIKSILTAMEHSDPNCLFCKIVSGDIPAGIVYRDNYVLAFRDIKPAAPEHLLIIPQKHIPSLNDLSGEEDTVIAGHILRAAGTVAEKAGIAGSGYRFVFNTGPDSLQSVFHIHGHLIGGRKMGWPPFPEESVEHG